MIQAYSKTSTSQESLYLFRQMLLYGRSALADNYTFTFVFTACSRHPALSDRGENVHGMVVKNGYESDVFVGNSLVNMYSIFSRMIEAERVFDEMPLRDVITWTSVVKGYAMRGELVRARELFDLMPERNDVSWAVMIAGYVGQRLYNDALQCFNHMLCYDEVKPNEAVLVSILSACAHLGALDQGKWIHVYMDKNSILLSSNISTALIDMYAKCGKIDLARRVFDGLHSRDLLTWTSLISGLSMHGLGAECLQTFSEMLAEGVTPDDITLLGVLNGCSHSGLIEEGLSIFHDMIPLWGISPKLEHYGCLIDLLSRAGRLESAFETIKSMPMEPDIVAWRALLSACRIHGDVDLGEKIINHIAELVPGSHGGGYALLSNLYASMGQWESVTKLRKAMNRRGDEGYPGCSSIEIDGVVHEFLAADKLHPRTVEINKKLNEVLRRISIEGGYVPSTKHVLFDLNEEDKEQAVAWHSEKLAIAFGLLCTQEGTIRITKNLRICEDCHLAMKAISLVFNREIVVRDRSRFHTFIHGNCSCADYW